MPGQCLEGWKEQLEPEHRPNLRQKRQEGLADGEFSTEDQRPGDPETTPESRDKGTPQATAHARARVTEGNVGLLEENI